MNNKVNGNLMLSSDETALFCGQAAMILKSGIPLVDGLTSLCEDFKGTKKEKAYNQLGIAIDETGSLSEALNKVNIFPDYAKHMIEIGESAGKIDDVLSGLNDYYNRDAQIRRNLRQAILYPVVLLILMGAVIGVLAIKILPLFNRVLASLNLGSTSVNNNLVSAGSVIGTVTIIIVCILIIAILILLVSLKISKKNKLIQLLQTKVPVIKRIYKSINAYRFSSAMAMLLESGYPLSDALSLLKELFVSKDMKDKIVYIYDKSKLGESFSKSVEEAKIFDSLHAKMLRAGDLSGKTDDVLNRLSGIYSERMERELSNLESSVEPTLVVLLAIIAGAILLSVMLPLSGLLSSML